MRKNEIEGKESMTGIIILKWIKQMKRMNWNDKNEKKWWEWKEMIGSEMIKNDEIMRYDKKS